MLMASVVRVKLLALAVTVEPVVMAEADKVVAVATVMAFEYVWDPEVEMLLVLIAVVPVTERFLAEPPRVTVSAAASPNTALPVMPRP